MKLAVAGANDRLLQVVELETGEYSQVSYPAFLGQCCFDSNNRYLAVVSGIPGDVHILDVPTLQELQVIEFDSYSVLFIPETTMLLCGGREGLFDFKFEEGRLYLLCFVVAGMIVDDSH
jgi:WD40 repeat protein